MKLIGYTRVSTQKQGASGLGLDAQLSAINAHAAQQQGEVVRIYREIESGRNNARPELAKAIAHAKRLKARLVIAKLDRLARDVYFVSGLTKSRVDFVCCDNPHANKLTIHILAAVAEDEAERISARTKAALAAAKARGTLLGSARPGHWDGREDRRLLGAARGRVAGLEVRRQNSAQALGEAAELACAKRAEGASYREIADALNEEGLTTARGKSWTAMQALRLVEAWCPDKEPK